VFPGQWALPGGGLEAGENAEAALRREMLEEVGLEMAQVEALFFSDGRYPKLFADGSQQEIYMVFLIYLCRPAGGEVRLNDEFEAYTWAGQEALGEYDLNIETAKTLQRMGLLPRGDG
jgi:nucleoside triphosphatase